MIFSLAISYDVSIEHVMSNVNCCYIVFTILNAKFWENVEKRLVLYFSHRPREAKAAFPNT